MTIYIGGPNETWLAFDSEDEVNAYRRALREAEPPLLRSFASAGTTSSICSNWPNAHLSNVVAAAPPKK